VFLTAGTSGAPVQNMLAPRPGQGPMLAKTCHRAHILPLSPVGGPVVNVLGRLVAPVWADWEEDAAQLGDE
jgi:hypothetical protein